MAQGAYLVLLERGNALGLALLSQGGEDINRFVSLNRNWKLKSQICMKVKPEPSESKELTIVETLG